MRELHYLQLVGAGTSNASDDVLAPYTPRGAIDTVMHIAVVNETSPCTRVRAGVKHSDILHWAIEVQSPGADVLRSTDDQFAVASGDQLIARFYGCTASDVLRVYAIVLREWLGTAS